MLTLLLVFAQAPTVTPLYPGKAPHAVGDSEFDKPKLHAYMAKEPTGTAVVVCPGGGYGNLAMDHEGKQVAEFLNSHGVHAFVLEYRVAKPQRPGPLKLAPLEDVQRALRTVRSKEGVDRKKVGIMGFSAGGHLASTAATHFDGGKEGDAIDKLSCKPDFAILCYPVINMNDDAVTHKGSRKNLLGDKPTAEELENFSNEKRVTAETPPTFIFHTHEDTGVVPENAIRFYLALKAAKVPAELHMYEKGKHGVGMNPKTGTATDQWGQRLAEWMVARGLAK